MAEMTMRSPYGRLRLHREYVVCCARCGRMHRTHCGERSRAEQILGIDGWRRLPREGWVCPSCLKGGDADA